ncbi:carbohydrate-binding module family 18 protein [Piromyces sp. E2]|nr:carbohydrate-binding module family 18 protein [Piromyces sp. E2]|eukprot:OUM61200.1 carbohydrate-binding module family 18 protein [Piromyces sp. E2]
MKFILSVTLLASTLLANAEARWKPEQGLTWDYLLGGSPTDIEASNKDVVTLDLEYAEKTVPILHSRGQKAICYFSGGTTDGKTDKEDYENAGIIINDDDITDGWGNKLLDIRKKDKLQPLIRKRFQRAVKYGCDAVEVDVLDVHNHSKIFTKNDSLTFAKWVAETGHEENISVGLKNLPSLAKKLEPYFDFAVVESCANYNECHYFQAFTKKGKAVYTVHYKDHEGHMWTFSNNDLEILTAAHNDSGFTCVLANLDLQSHSDNYNCITGVRMGQGKKTTTTTTTIKRKTTTKKSTPTSTGGSTDRCGKEFGISCASGLCCSKYGWCGTTGDHCGTGCQKGYGKCLTVSTNDRCGNGYVCPEGECCSKFGWCGTTNDHCLTGCQIQFGTCK